MNLFAKIWLSLAWTTCLSLAYDYDMEALYEWKYIDYDWPSKAMKDNYIAKGRYNFTGIIPGDINRARDGRVFMSLVGTIMTPAAVNLVSENSGPGGPLLRPYPDWSYYSTGTCMDIKSVVRTAIDKCNRLWVLDSGSVIGDPNPPCPSQLLVFDLKTNKELQRVQIPRNIVANKEGNTLLAFPAVETHGPACQRTIIYMADVFSSSLLVYDHTMAVMKKFTDATFNPDPTSKSFEISGNKWDMSDGLLGLTLVPIPGTDEYSLFYRPLASKTLYVMDHVPNTNLFTEELGAGTITTMGNLLKEQVIGQDYSPQQNAIFFGLTTSTGIGCWNIKDRGFNVELVSQDRETLQYPNGVHVFGPEVTDSGEEELWVFTNRYFNFLLGKVNFSEVNFRVMMAPVRELVKGTKCDGSLYNNNYYPGFYGGKKY